MFLLHPPDLLRRRPFSERENACNSQKWCPHKVRRDSKSHGGSKNTTRSKFTTRSIFSTAGSFGWALSVRALDLRPSLIQVLCDPPGPSEPPPNPQNNQSHKKWLKSGFLGSSQSNPESDSKVTKVTQNGSKMTENSLLSHFRGDPQKSLLSHFFVTLIVLWFGGFCGARRVTIQVGSSQTWLFQTWLSATLFCALAFVLFCAHFCVFLHPTAFRMTVFGNFRTSVKRRLKRLESTKMLKKCFRRVRKVFLGFCIESPKNSPPHSAKVCFRLCPQVRNRACSAWRGARDSFGTLSALRHQITFSNLLKHFWAFGLFWHLYQAGGTATLDGPNRQSLVFSERSQLSQAIPRHSNCGTTKAGSMMTSFFFFWKEIWPPMKASVSNPSRPYPFVGEIRLICSQLSVRTRSREQMELIAVFFAFQHLRSRSKCLYLQCFAISIAVYFASKSLTCIFQNNTICGNDLPLMITGLHLRSRIGSQKPARDRSRICSRKTEIRSRPPAY